MLQGELWTGDAPASATATPARPFLKWAGGKQALAAEIVARIPRGIERYVEPFLGGGSVFFTLAPSAALLGDGNDWLIDTYAAIRKDWRPVAARLDKLVNTETEYLRIRAVDPAGLDPAARAAHFIYLNKTGFRGLFRVNREGRFNVPYGAYDRRYYDPDELAAAARALRGAELRAGDFEATLAEVSKRDFVYLDPPYWKLGGFSDFNRYTPGQFREEDHRRLAACCRELDRRGARFLLSNSDTPFVRELYAGFRFERIAARREIQLDPAKRDVAELLIANFPEARRRPDS
jgi:DNA adenine methylase